MITGLLLSLLIAPSVALQDAAPPTTRPEPDRGALYDQAVRERQSIRQSIEDGLKYLAQSQQADGSWGTGLSTRGMEVYSSVPGSLDTFKTAATALAVLALQESGGANSAYPEVYRKGLHWLKTDGRVRRDQKDLMYNIWAHTYALQAMAEEMIAGNEDPKVRETAEYHLGKMVAYETYVGGWNYYDFAAGTQRPSMEPTSFGTAAGLLALRRAREAGLDVPEGTIRRSVNRLKDARRPDGAFLYGSGYRYGPNAGANKWQGAAARSQAGNYVLWLFGVEGLDLEDLDRSLSKLQENWIYLNIGRKRPFPHEAFYQNSGYYYYFGMYHAAREVEVLAEGDAKRVHAENVRKMIMPFQEADGSWWDYAMWDYHKPYGTAYAIMALHRLDKALAPAAEKGN